MLTEAEREAWRLYAANVSWKNALGETTFLTGQQHFIRTNTARLQAGIEILDAAPKIFDLGTFTAPTIQLLNSTPEASVAFDNTDDWAIAVGGYMLIWTGRATGPGRTFYRSPWRYGGKVEGAVVPPTSPATVTPPWPYHEYNIAWLQIRVVQTDGRMSAPVILGPEAISGPP